MLGIGELDDLDEIVQAFLQESAESLDEYDQALVALENEPASRDLLFAIFRIVHTVKGTCGFLPFPRLERLAHTGEELLVRLRDGHLHLDSILTDVLLDLGDAIRVALRTIETTGAEGQAEHSGLITRIERTLATATDGGPIDPPPGLDVVMALDPAPRATGPHADDPADDQPCERIGASAGGKVRVDVELLDSMMRLIGELVLTRNQLGQCATEVDNPELRHLTQRLQLISTGLQDEVMQARMQPIGNAWKRLPRMVRDLGLQLDKPVVLETSGEDTELDRTLLEAIKDPLTHLLRNAVDHGIETPQARAALGKPAIARLRLAAYHRGGLVHIEVADDGAGIDTESLRAKAVVGGLVGADEVGRLTEQETLQLVFQPGLSTAAEVSSLSGRGVGMDVVRTNIERIGGLVDIETWRGEGTVFRVKIPLTLAIVPAVVVRADGQRFAVPQGHVRELVHVGDDTLGVEYTHRAPVYRLRGELLPLVDLRSHLRLPDAETPGRAIVVLNAQGAGVGLIVDGIVGTEEIVVKPLGAVLRDLREYAGAATMSDGGVALILDVAEAARRAGIDAAADDPADAAHELAGGHAGALPNPDRQEGSGVPALLVELVGGDRVTVPLMAVRRLETIPVASIDVVGVSRVVSYRDGILPLVDAGRCVHSNGGRVQTAAPTLPLGSDRVTVIVCHVEEVTVGLPVAGIVDTVVTQPLSDAGIEASGPVTVEGRVVPMVDVDGLLLQVDPALMPHTTRAGAL